jgi:hypothetical protein
MRKMLLLSMVLLLASTLAFAQPPGSIGLFADPGATNCDVYDQVPGLVIIYVVHVYTPGATAAQFMVVCAWGSLMTYLAETPTPPYICIGNSQTGVACAYGGCVPSPNVIMTLTFFGSGISAPCSYCQVMADPSATPPGIYVTDCASPPNLLNATGGDVVINPIPGCFCNIPVEETSWGHIKNLYQ